MSETVDLIRLEPSTLAVPGDSHGKILGLVDLWLAGLAPTSRRTYASALRDFASIAGMEVAEVVRLLLVDRGGGHAMVLAYRAHLMEAGRAAASINSRLSALRSLVTHARRLGLVDWALDIPGVPARAYRDTRGPGRPAFVAMLKAAKLPRDKAILWCLYGLALRRSEVAELDVDDVQGDALMVRGKGHHDKAPVSMPPQVRRAMATWIEVRGIAPGPLFTSNDRARKGTGRLTGGSIAVIVRALGAEVGATARPHGLRHTAITEALDKTGGNMRAVAKFSRHADIRTIGHYDDNRADLGGAVAALVAGAADLSEST